MQKKIRKSITKQNTIFAFIATLRGFQILVGFFALLHLTDLISKNNYQN
jgi:hypothetical protein